MSCKSTFAVAISLVLASTALASAAHAPGKHKSLGGIVASDGSIVLGSGFSVSHDGTGEYTLDVPSFPDCPVVFVQPAGINGHLPIANDFNYITCNTAGGEAKIQIRIYSRTDGSLQDNGFHFLMASP